ncbi:AzlC family ABC transporter permease [Marinomonas sp. M1K-6]|uniref:AzlC family ABC transporter permease n=1 Tax=Marinomonas profundi TaxID=2726122 RepID=A0A847R7G9_9GAMM|nr:AzlC family ABC transporter permease [Marinomonas profundi]NLQ16210.1 AzlC family ABC transporter permease [Marinomonas profundi]UDV03210.1 AzlC family ABC transporter permease [Marinomonas profundi]
MSTAVQPLTRTAWVQGVKDATPLLGGYIPVAISFGLISIQSGFSVLETILISIFIYAGASQFLFVAMVASGAPLWLVVVMTLLINARHLVYGPNLAPYLNKDRRWIALMHGLTDQIFALAHVRLPQLPNEARIGWYTGAAILAWFSWIGGTALGAIAGGELTQRWPMINDILPFALPALFLVLIIPKCNNPLWALTIGASTLIALILKVLGYPNVAIPLAAFCGAIVFYALKNQPSIKGQ